MQAIRFTKTHYKPFRTLTCPPVVLRDLNGEEILNMVAEIFKL